ncbi:MAG: DUF3828 domain-containing protein [Bacteroidia bacterium]
MKYLLIFFLAFSLLLSCNNATSTSQNVSTDTGGLQDDPDLVAIDACIHGFYQWYETNMNTLANIAYVRSGKPATLDNANLDEYYAKLKQSGFISQVYIDGDRAYLKNLEATYWKDEDVTEQPLSGLDYDRFFCGQDYDIVFWTTAPVAADGLGTNQATATLSGVEWDMERTQKFEMVRENGKWRIAKILCETGE